MALGMQVTRDASKGRSPIRKQTTSSRCSRHTAWGGANRSTRSASDRSYLSTRERDPFDQSRHAAEPVHRQQRRVPGLSKPLRHPLPRQPAKKGIIEPIESAYGSNQASTPLPHRQYRFQHILLARGVRLTAFSDANCGINPDNGKSTPSYIMMMCNGSASFKEGIQVVTVQSTMEAELVAAALATKEALH